MKNFLIKIFKIFSSKKESDIDFLRQNNSLPSLNSAWYIFSKTFNMGIQDLDRFANLLGFLSFEDLEKENPKNLFNKDRKTFLILLKRINMKSLSINDVELIKIITALR